MYVVSAELELSPYSRNSEHAEVLTDGWAPRLSADLPRHSISGSTAAASAAAGGDSCPRDYVGRVWVPRGPSVGPRLAPEQKRSERSSGQQPIAQDPGFITFPSLPDLLPIHNCRAPPPPTQCPRGGERPLIYWDDEMTSRTLCPFTRLHEEKITHILNGKN